MMEKMLYDSEAMRLFAGIELGNDCISDEGFNWRIDGHYIPIFQPF
jgi:hypothetical protein